MYENSNNLTQAMASEPTFVKMAHEISSMILSVDHSQQHECFNLVRQLVLQQRDNIIRDANSDIEAIQIKVKGLHEGNKIISQGV